VSGDTAQILEQINIHLKLTLQAVTGS
jgi:hypothetical protein